MKRQVFLALTILLVASARDVRAALHIRAIYPNPPGNDDTEWIALENTSDASISAQLYTLADTVGSVRTATFSGWFAGREVRLISATSSGIVLNNTGDQVVLKKQGEVVESSPSYQSLTEGLVWTKIDAEWQGLSLSEFMSRLEQKNWSASGEEQPALEEAEAVNNQESYDNQPRATPVVSKKIDVLPSQPQHALPRLFPSNPQANSRQILPFPTPPLIDYAAEQRVFLDWKKKALAGSFLLMFGGICALIPLAPKVSRYCYEWLLW